MICSGTDTGFLVSSGAPKTLMLCYSVFLVFIVFSYVLVFGPSSIRYKDFQVSVLDMKSYVPWDVFVLFLCSL